MPATMNEMMQRPDKGRPGHGVPSQMAEGSSEPRKAIELDEGTSEPGRATIPAFGTELARGESIAPIVMLGSAVAFVLPPWVERTMRAPPSSIGIEGIGVPASPSRRWPAERVLGPKPTPIRQEPSGQTSQARVRMGEVPEKVTARPDAKEGAERQLSERDVVRIVKRWMEEEAKRKGFM